MSTNRSGSAAIAWHIFKKDWSLLKWLVLSSFAVQVLLAVVIYRPEPVALTRGFQGIAALLSLGLGTVLGLLIVLAVQQEAIPGVTQDWLVRPIRHRDLLLAKLLFVVLMVHGPIIATTLLRSVVEGFDSSATLRATLLSNLQLGSLFTLPMMAIAAMTRTVTEALIGVLGVIAILVLTYLTIRYAFHLPRPTSETGLAWVWESVSHALFIFVTLAALLIQYFRRATRLSRIIFIAGAMLAVVVPGLPWQPAFAVQKWLSPSTNADHSLAVAFEPAGSSADGTRPGALIARAFLQASEEKRASEALDTHSVRVLLPVQLSGVPAGLIVHADRTLIRVMDVAGRAVFRGTAKTFDLRSSDTGEASTFRQVLDIPSTIYNKVAGHMMILEADYSLTLLQPRTLASIGALNGRKRLPGGGQCSISMDSENKGIEVSCRTVGESPPCVSVMLEQAASEQHNPEVFECELNYKPAALRFSMEPIEHFQALLPFSGTEGSAHYPMDAAHLRDAQVIIRVYEPYDHLSRHVTMPQFRLRDYAIADVKQTASKAEVRESAQ